MNNCRQSHSLRTFAHRSRSFVFALALAFVLPFQASAIPQLVNLQGRVSVSGVLFDSATAGRDGEFKFALVDGAGNTLWSNDGTPSGEPAAAVALTVQKGLYSLLLGDTTLPNMTTLPTAVFADNDTVFLRVWFGDGTGGLEQLSPDRRIAAVGYAIMAEKAASVVDGAIGSAQLADGAVTAEKLAPSLSFAKLQHGTAEFNGAPGVNPYQIVFPVPFADTPLIADASPGAVAEITATGISGSFTVPLRTDETTVDSGFILYNSLAIIDGRPAVSYVKDSTNLKFAISASADGSGPWTPVTVSAVVSASVIGPYTSLASIAGKPCISYYDDTTRHLKFAYNPVANANAPWTITSADTPISGGYTGWHPSLAEVDGRPAISYFDASGAARDLRFAINSSPDGSGTWTRTNVDTPGDVGWFSSLAIIDGRPAISYRDHSGPLKFAINAEPDASGAWTISTVDSAAGLVNTTTPGLRTSLEVVDGRPAISYANNNNGSLKFAINANADGSGAWTFSVVDADGNSPSLAVVGGKPAISYSAGFAINENTDGSGAWLKTPDAGGVHSSLLEIDSRPGISSGTEFFYPNFAPGSVEIEWTAIGR